MIRVRIKNFRGCRTAAIECEPVALVAGRNGAGKTSIAQAAAAALIGDPLIGGLTTKAGAAALVHDGTMAGTAEIEGDAGRVRIDWPDAAAASTGAAPQASAFAAGVASIATFERRARGPVLSEYLRADPDRAELDMALREAGLTEAAVADAVWQLIADHGWDDAHTIRRDRGAELKGGWRQVTGQAYGSRIGASWHPADWSSDLEDAAEDRLTAEIDRARAAYEQAIGRRAVSIAERERLAGEAAALDARKDALRDAEAEAERIGKAIDQAKRTRAALPTTPGGAPMPCPHCGGLLELQKVSLVETRLVAAEIIAPAALKAQRAAIAAADGTISRLTAEGARAHAAVERARASMQQASEAKHHLAALPAGADNAAAETAAAKADFDRATARERAWRVQNEADALHRRIAQNEVLLKILGGDGLRAAKLGRVLDAFNRTSLAELTTAADWPAVEVAPDMAISMGSRAYPLLSTSEQYRVRVTLQVAMARIDGSAMVVIDAADVLDARARSGLMALLDAAGLPALVCMTATRAGQVPDLAAAGIGASYWIAEGEAVELGEKVAA